MRGAAVTADFETTTDERDCRVWAWAVAYIDDPERTACGNDIRTFFRWVSKKQITNVWFHNLAFDGKFIIDFLLKSGYSFTTEKTPRKGEFSTLISNKGKFYQIKISFLNASRVTINDSLKVFPMTVKALGKKLGDPDMQKGELDYRAYRAPGHALTDEEIEYILHDVKIPARALAENFSNGLDKMTIGANAMHWFKKGFGSKKFKRLFPVLSLDLDAELRKGYRGGYTAVNPEYAGVDVHDGISVDYNSMYPSVMKMYPYPVGVPLEFKGEYVHDSAYPLFVQRMTCLFKLKPEGLPCVQLRGHGFYGAHEYVRETVEPVQLTVTSVDLEIMERMYDLDVLSYDGGWKFFQAEGLFDDYIDHWGAVKERSTGANRLLAKLMLNNLYGKFATNPDVTPKIPELSGREVDYVLGDQETRDPVYLPVAMFCTAYARRELLFAIMDNRERFVYCDTDSMHLLGTETPKGIRIDDKKLGHWKVEGTFTHARHLRAKAYIWDLNGEFSVTCAGMSDNIKELVTWGNFHFGFSNLDSDGNIIPGHGKLVPKQVPGGVVLVDRPYVLHT